MEHGADLLTYQDRYDGELIDFSSNINPLGPPEGLENVLIDSFKTLITYPDIKYRKLKESISNYLACHKENVLVGNGAVEIIDSFVMATKRVIITTPSFSEYEKRAVIHGKEVIRIPYKEDFCIDLDRLDVIRKGDLLILGNPNNPTGLRIEKGELKTIYEMVKKAKGFLLLDEAFFEFCPEDYDSIEIFKEYNFESVGIIRAATKFFALPGIRLGYGCTSMETAKKIERNQLPWSVNTLADAAGQFIFNDKEYIEKSKLYINNERHFLLDELSKIEGINVYNSHTNYILIKLLEEVDEHAFNYFLQHGMVLRKCSSFLELGNNHIRVAVKDRKNNLRLLNAFREYNCKKDESYKG